MDAAKIRGGVRDLAHDLLTIEATGDYAGAKRMLDTLGVLRPEMRATLAAVDKAGAVPVDIRPIFVTAEEIAPAPSEMVRMKGLEPSLPFGNQNLNLARLPVSPHPHGRKTL